MNKRRALWMWVPVLGTAALMFSTWSVGALGEDDLFFSDDFSGSTVDAAKWNTSIAVEGIRFMDGAWTQPPAGANHGSVTVADSRLSLDNPAPALSCPMFPLLWTNNAIPPAGNFELEFRMRYTGGGYWGDGVRVVRMPSPFDPSPGSTEPATGEYVLMIHQDNHDCKGPNVSLPGHPGEGTAALPFNTDWHTYTLRYEGTMATLYVDGAYLTGPHSAPRPNCIQLGVGEVGCCADSCEDGGCRWTSYDVDYFRVKLLATTPVKVSSWGAVKRRYR